MTDKTDYYVEYHQLRRRSLIRSLCYLVVMGIGLVMISSQGRQIEHQQDQIEGDQAMLRDAQRGLDQLTAVDHRLESDCRALADLPHPPGLTCHRDGDLLVCQ
jgi:hypothetical protein